MHGWCLLCKIMTTIKTVVILTFCCWNLVQARKFRSLPDEVMTLAQDDVMAAFRDWMSEFGKDYPDLMTTWKRYKAFKENMQRAVKLNMKHKGRATFGMTKFADLNPDEFAQTFLKNIFDQFINGSIPEPPVPTETLSRKPDTTDEPLPDDFDWTTQGVVTSVKNQGMVGSCYIFSALTAIESRWALKGNNLVSLSVEQVADCLADVGFFSKHIACGVNGGLPQAVYKYVRDQGGITSESDYPYCAGSNACFPCPPPGYTPIVCGIYPFMSCRKEDSCDAKFDKSKFVEGLRVKDWSDLPYDEEMLASTLVKEGPLSAGLDATDLQLYRSGILTPDKCKSNHNNHAVTLVGYGRENEMDYWKVKNSWGSRFGEDGYFRIARGQGTCGINKMVTTVTLE